MSTSAIDFSLDCTTSQRVPNIRSDGITPMEGKITADFNYIN
jgi:hypothetical protein